MKFIHAADVHLDSPLVGLGRYEGAPVEKVRLATRQALENLVTLAINEEVTFVLFGGDLYDGDWKDFNTGLFFINQMAKLWENGIRAFLVTGNHDAASQITRRLRLPDNVHRFSEEKSESVFLDEYNVAIHGQGFDSRAVTRNLAKEFPDATPGLFNIGLLHTCANGREGHEPYAPCEKQDLLSKGYDYWALGHVHKYELLHEDPWVVFPGNTQGRFVRENGEKGCVLVTVEDSGEILIERKSLDVLRWLVCEVDITDSDTGAAVLDRVEDALRVEFDKEAEKPLAVRVRLLGACAAHRKIISDTEYWTNEIRALSTNLSAGEIWIERLEIGTRQIADYDEAVKREDAFGGLLRSISAIDTDQPPLANEVEEFKALARTLKSIPKSGEGIDLENPETLSLMLEEVKQLLINRVLSEGE